MSDADIPTPLSNAEDREAMEFPEAMDIEALEGASLESDTPNPSQNPQPNPEPNRLADAIAIIDALRQDKRQLQDRVWDLEATLNRMEHGTQAPKSPSHPMPEPLEGHGTAQQPALEETIQTQLEICQHQMARMEREFALVQQRYNQQTHQLQLSEQNALELQSRLNRQQRYTLQFKAALEKCLEAVRDRDFATEPIDRSAMQVFLDKAQPVEPWSVDAMEAETAQTEEMPSVAATPRPSELAYSEGLERVSQERETIDDDQEEEEDNPEGETGLERDSIDTEASPELDPELDPETGISQNTQPSVLPPELTIPQRPPISKLDLPKFPPLKVEPPPEN